MSNKIMYHKVSAQEVINLKKYCPIDLATIPNTMGINLTSIDSVNWSTLPDGQIINVTINFLPNLNKRD